MNSSIQSKNEKSRKSTRVPNIGATGEPNFLTPDAKKAFNYLRLAFIKAPILQHFDPESHIRIETDVPGYAIGRVSSQLSLDSHAPSNQWHPIAYFSRNMIPAKTQYETHNAELMAIIIEILSHFYSYHTFKFLANSCVIFVIKLFSKWKISMSNFILSKYFVNNGCIYLLLVKFSCK